MKKITSVNYSYESVLTFSTTNEHTMLVSVLLLKEQITRFKYGKTQVYNIMKYKDIK